MLGSFWSNGVELPYKIQTFSLNKQSKHCFIQLNASRSRD
jgi:hypothetical protein